MQFTGPHARHRLRTKVFLTPATSGCPAGGSQGTAAPVSAARSRPSPATKSERAGHHGVVAKFIESNLGRPVIMAHANIMVK